jgi:APA family basic amino acid/polyamine antiporter
MDFKSVLSRKPVSEIVASQDSPDRRLSKVLGPFSIAAMGIGAIIGAGIFVLTGTAAALYAGPAIVLSFMLAAIACSLVGLCYAELSAFLPVSGSSYTYATLGELAAWVIGWDLILEYAMGGATVAVGWSGYFNSLLGLAGIGLDPRLVAATGQAVTLADGTTAAAIANLPAAGIVVLITVLLVLGTRESARLNNVMVAVKLTVVLAFVVLGAFYVRSANWHPFIPPNAGEFGSFGLSGILRGASTVFFAYIGFDAVSNCAQEARRPQRDMPIGILGSLAASTVLYIAVAAVLTGLVPYAELNVPDPVAKGVRVIGHEWFSLFIELGALIGLTTVILVLLYGQSRIFAAMANDGLLPPLFARVHPTLRTPYISQLVIGGLVVYFAYGRFHSRLTGGR